MTAPLTGFTSSFPSDVVLDSGVLYIGSSIFSCLRGGLKFDPGITMRNIPFDGQRSPIKGIDRKTMVTPKISGTMIELAEDQIAQIEPGSTQVGSSQYQGKRAGILLASGDYLTNVRAIWLRGNGQFVQVRFPSALLMKYDATSVDGDELSIAIEIEARLDMTASGVNIGDMPYLIEYLSTIS
jgi:hypothetical protein